MACHVEHVRARSSKVKLSARDSAILAHLSVKEFRRPGTLARHLGIASSTLSEALHGLVSLGYVTVRAESDDQRRAEFKLSESGIEAMKASSVLDSRKVTEALSRLSPEKRKKVVDGLRLLADSFV
jgi:DNA-binding MarR family transcriptional regulator